MDKKQIQVYVDEIINQFNKIESMYDKLNEIFTLDPGAPIATIVYETFNLYVKATSQIIGDKDNWIDWYIWDNDCGKKGFEAKTHEFNKMKKINTTKDLVKLIMDSQR